MIESRCGLRCGECTYREQMNCKGCVELADGPFWGKCEIKACCEGKALHHCGECAAFPCDMLNRFAYDENQGDNGKRIVQCREWCGMQKSENKEKKA